MVKIQRLAAACVIAGLIGCGKSAEPAKTAEQQKIEKDAANKAVRENPVYGEQFKSLDKAKATAAAAEDAAKKTTDELKKLDEAK